MKTTSTKIVLRCSKNDCCPTVEFYPDGSIDIRDQDDGKDEQIRLTPEQAVLLKLALNERSL